MKKNFLLTLISLSLNAFAQEDNIPHKVEEAFFAKYPNELIDNWISNDGLYYLEFYLKREMYTAVFTAEGIWKETSEIISDTDIPEKLNEYLKKNYPDFNIIYSEKFSFK